MGAYNLVLHFLKFFKGGLPISAVQLLEGKQIFSCMSDGFRFRKD